jgi:nicotinamidase-related amidase
MQGHGSTGLLVIDVQNAMVDICHRRAEVLGNIAALLERARREGLPVVYVQHDHDDYEQMMPGHVGWQIHDDVAPRPGEPVLHKNGADAFENEALDKEFRSRGVDRVVVTGMATDHCVDAAIHSGLSLGYEITVASDAHTTARDDDVLIEMGLEGRGGKEAGAIMAEHNRAWAELARSGRPVAVTPTRDIAFA